jgi:hypothetical protein
MHACEPPRNESMLPHTPGMLLACSPTLPSIQRSGLPATAISMQVTLAAEGYAPPLSGIRTPRARVPVHHADRHEEDLALPQGKAGPLYAGTVHERRGEREHVVPRRGTARREHGCVKAQCLADHGVQQREAVHCRELIRVQRHVPAWRSR